MHRRFIGLVAAASIAALAHASPALAGHYEQDECGCAPPPVPVFVEPAPAPQTPRYFVDQGPTYTGPGLVIETLPVTDSPTADPYAYPYVRSYHGWYFAGASHRRW
jgi:hypothetical protein